MDSHLPIEDLLQILQGKKCVAMQKITILLNCFCCASLLSLGQGKPLRVGVIGLTHGHVHWILGRPADSTLVITGIVESNQELAHRLTQQYGLPMSLVYASMDELIDKALPDAVLGFGSTFEHLAIVEKFAPLGIHIMVEKPLAVNLAHARKMQALARQHQVFLLTNYETTWYPTVHKAQQLLAADSIGSLSQLVVRDGHRGPLMIGVDKEFLAWLTHPRLNGGGAITDFGCYGANIATWLLQGEKPLSVIAVTQQLQKENNPLVEDEATLLLTYRQAKVTIQASWNWPIGRKDMEVYGKRGVLYADNRTDLRIRMAQGYDGFRESKFTLPELAAPHHDPFAHFAAVVARQVVLPPFHLASLENNMLVMEILEAAKTSARKGKAVRLQ